MTILKPVPTMRDDGGADFRDPGCELICYSINKEGMQIGKKCEFLSIGDNELLCDCPGDC